MQLELNKIGNQNQVRVNVTKDDLKSAGTVVCKCGCKVFIPGVAFKKISGILVGSSNKYELIPLQGIFVCPKCGEVAPFIKDDPNLGEIIGLTEE